MSKLLFEKRIKIVDVLNWQLHHETAANEAINDALHDAEQAEILKGDYELDHLYFDLVIDGEHLVVGVYNHREKGDE